MGNSENAKIKTLVLYDYFLKYVNAYDDVDKIKMSDIRDYLLSVTGEQFERKSVYSDIAKLNEFVVTMGLVNQGEEWISLEGNNYTRSELKGELTPDEAKLIVDAINTTSFVDSGICDKVKSLYPSYFSDYRPLIPHGKKGSITQKTKNQLNLIRSCITNAESITFVYGYLVAGGFRGQYEVSVSPLELDWEKNGYYLIAISNAEYARTNDVLSSIRKYRIDRIMNVSIDMDVPYVSCDSKTIKTYLEHTVNAFSCYDYKTVTIDLKFGSESECLRAYSAFADEVEIACLIKDNITNGEVKFAFKAPLMNSNGNKRVVPTLYPILYMIYTFPGIKSIEIDDEEVKGEFENQLRSALKVLK